MKDIWHAAIANSLKVVSKEPLGESHRQYGKLMLSSGVNSLQSLSVTVQSL